MRMRSVMLFAALAAAVASTAYGADMPLKAPAAPAPLAGSGLIIGINAGAAFTGESYDFVTIPGQALNAAGFSTNTGKLYPAGVMTGLTIGVGGSVGNGVYTALETEWDYDFTKFSTTCPDGQCSSKNSIFLAQKAVFGLSLSSITGAAPTALTSKLTPPSQWPIPLAAPTNLSLANVMPAVVAGIAEHNISACISGMPCGQRWVVGLLTGMQLRFPVAANWTAAVEYDYIFFNKSFTPANSVGVFPATFKELNEQRAMIKLDYHL